MVAHFGAGFDLCVVKRLELEAANRKYNGRAMFGGHNVKDDSGMDAVLSDLGSGVSFVTACKLLDTESLLPGNMGEQSDALSANAV